MSIRWAGTGSTGKNERSINLTVLCRHSVPGLHEPLSPLFSKIHDVAI